MRVMPPVRFDRLSFRTPVLAVVAFSAAMLSACGYHVSGKTDLLPKTIQTIAIPAFDNITTRYKLTDRLPEAISRELIARTRYRIVPDTAQADAVLRGAVVNYVAYPTVFDQASGRASGLQANVTMQISLTERATGKVIFARPSFEIKQQYEISTVSSGSPRAYFEESETALDRLSRDLARKLVSAILENF
jgi:outer membrane lipopolysaccharide assembly protein LptE/RlpB